MQSKGLTLLCISAASVLFGGCTFEDSLSQDLGSDRLVAPPAGPEAAFNIVGDDDRKDAYEVSDYKAALMSDYVVTLTSFNRLERLEDGSWKANRHGPLSESLHEYVGFDERLNEKLPVCRDVKFAKQKLLGGCSGTLISDNIIATAAHCIGKTQRLIDLNQERWCSNRAFVFDFAYTEQEKNTRILDKNDVYGCKRVLNAVLERGTNFRRDWAFIELDRPVTGHIPASVVPMDSQPVIGDRTVGMYHPQGLPAKYDDGGRVTSFPSEFEIASTLDAFGGCSGGGVYDSEHRLVAIHWGSDKDWVEDSEIDHGMTRPCVRHNTLQDNDRNGSSHCRIHSALGTFCPSFAHLAPMACQNYLGRSAYICEPCESSWDCGPGITCSHHQESGVGRCSVPCQRNEDCPAGSFCSAEAAFSCAPIESERCLNSYTSQKFDICGVPTREAQECPPDSLCRSGKCRYPEDISIGKTCRRPIAIDMSPEIARVYGATDFGLEKVESTCSDATGDAAVYSITLDRERTLMATVFGHNTVLMIRKDCESMASEVACNDDGLGNSDELGSRIIQTLDAGTYFVLVQSYGAKDSKNREPFQLDLQFLR